MRSVAQVFCGSRYELRQTDMYCGNNDMRKLCPKKST